MLEPKITKRGKVQVIARIALFWVGYLAILVGASVPKSMVPPVWGQLVWGVISSVGIAVLTLFALRKTGRRVMDVGLGAGPNRFARIASGLAIGFGVYGLMLIAISTIVGRLHFTRIASPGMGVIAVTVASYIALAMMEELGFRGYSLRRLAASLGKWPAQLIVALAFCASHVAFGWPWQSIALGVLPSALLFGVVALESGDLLMAVAVHAAMNIGQWIVGEKAGTPGFWQIALDEHARSNAAVIAPLIGFAVTLLSTYAVWLWYKRANNKHIGVVNA
jgi:uncharacterized protein